MKVEIQVVSRDKISPSSPTPDDLKILELSYLDQMNLRFLMPHLLFYKADDCLSNSQIAARLRKSLSQTLSLYYPLAGRLVDNTSVNCNDEGVTYVEAQANCNILDVVNEPNPEEFSKFLPCDPEDVRDRCLAIQATFFMCGGLAIAVAISHKVADAWSLLMFLNSWAATSRGDSDNIISPQFNCASFFPPRDTASTKPVDGVVVNEDAVMKRFLFTPAKINELKDKYTKDKHKKKPVCPTRTEALSAFIWTRFMVSTQTKDDPTKICTLFQAVSIRKRAVPPLPNESFGNLYVPTITVPSLGDDEENTYGIVEIMREAIDSINGDYVNQLLEGRDHFAIMNNQAKKILRTGEELTFVFSSLCKLPLYEADFGWGKPLLFGFARLRKNVVLFVDSSSGGGIEAWITLKSEDMAKFGADEELLAYVAN